MSRAVDTAKPVAEQLAQGLAGRYDETQLAKLIPWLSITTTMQEFISPPETIVIPSNDRQLLKDTNLPPPDWTIWIGCYGGVGWLPINHARYSAQLQNRISRDAEIQPPLPKQRIQAATFTLRHLFVHAFNATSIDLVNEYRQFVRGAGWNLFQIWPTGLAGINWPGIPIFDVELHAIVTKFGRDRQGHQDMGFHFGR